MTVRIPGWTLIGLALGCSGTPAPRMAAAPTPAPPAPAVAADDDAADAVILSELRELEFSSLSKGGRHVRVVLTAPSAEAYPDLLIPGENRSGGGAARGTTYDLDVESFVGHRRVQYYIDYFRNPARNRFGIWLERLARYEGMIRQVFRQHGLPEDLVYLGLIESGYSNSAVSHASAVGMWQFIASTGRRYGLRIDDWVDERRDPFRSTDAAARHLADLKDQFGSWYLAAAAYNAGSGRVRRGLRRLRDRSPSDTTFFDLYDRRYLRRETRDYVPKLIAATLIAKDPADYGFTDVGSQSPLTFDEITVPGQTGLDVLAGLADTTARALRDLNPQYFRGATPPGEQATVRVPRGAAQKVLARYETLPVSERLNFIQHRVRRGETLSLIAQRYRVPLRYVRQANPRVRPRRLKIGQHLVIPVSRAARRGTAVSSRPRRAAPARGVHTVRRGDTLWLVAQRYGVSIRDLRRWNRIPRNVSLLEIGQRLRVAPPDGP